MRLYYLVEREGDGYFVRAALGVDADRWSDLFRDVLDWRLELYARCGIDPRGELQAPALLAPRHDGEAHLPPVGGAPVFMSGLRVIEQAARRGGGIEVITVCLPTTGRGRHEEVSLGRLLTRINTSVIAAGTHAFLIFDEVPEAPVTRLYRRLCVHNPIPSRFRAWGDGAPTRNIPLTRVVGGPAFRSARDDHLLQLVGFVAHALLLQEDGHGGAPEDLGLDRAFSILDRALNRRASRRDPQGVVRR
ncbi:MAG: hypothetical protein OXS47_08460 [Chloroflexota bacterium]|nr:hypothetical protein [Chloroflexota bacterium]